MLPAQVREGGVVLLAYYYKPMNTSGVQRAWRLAKYLPEYGRPVRVICSGEEGEAADAGGAIYAPNPKTMATAAPIQARLARAIERIAPYHEKMPWVPHAVAAADQLIPTERIACVVSTSPPVGTHLAAMWLKFRHRVRWVADFRDPLCGNPGRARKWAKPYDQALEQAIFGAADAVIAVTDSVRDEWIRRYPGWRDKFHLVWNGFDPEETIVPVPPAGGGRRLLTHVGVLYAQRHPRGLVASLERLVRSGRMPPETFRLRLVGPAQEAEAFVARPDVRFLMGRGCLELVNRLLPREEARSEMAASDFLLLIDIVNLANIGYTVPAKLFEYVPVGRPILAITDQGSPVQRILSRSGVPAVFLYHEESAAEADAKVEGLFRLSAEPSPPSEWFLENFDGRRQAGTFARILGSIGA